MVVNTAFRLGLGTKVSALIAGLLLIAVATLVGISTRLFVQDNTDLIQTMNTEVADGLAVQTRQLLARLADRMMYAGSLELRSVAKPEAKAAILRELFSGDEDLLAVVLVDHAAPAASRLRVAWAAPSLAGKARLVTGAITSSRDLSPSELREGQSQLARVTMGGGSAVALGVPFVRSERDAKRFTHSLIGLVRPGIFRQAIAENALVTTFLVDRKGNCVYHAESAKADAGESFAHLAVVQALLKGDSGNRQIAYRDSHTGEERLGAFHVVGLAGVGAIAEVPKAKASEIANWVRYRSMLVAIIVVCIAVLAGQLLADQLTSPIYDLVRAAIRISKGDFKIDLKPRTRDEVGYLSAAFNQMAQGLDERERYKNMMDKFHSKEIVDKLLTGEVRLGGERRRATILFCDIRGFTRQSDGMEPEAVVEMLNEYLARMVPIVTAYGGVVDKYMGDAVMALWGVPIEHPDDAVHAVRACLAMREELAELNKDRIARGKPAIRIGMGVNSGPVTAGNIGSRDRMEYTVIGGAVNVASRVEAATKVYGTDLLVERTVADAVGKRFVMRPCGNVKVKGKDEPLELFRVQGYYDEDGKPVLVETPYMEYPPEASEKVSKPKAA